MQMDVALLVIEIAGIVFLGVIAKVLFTKVEPKEGRDYQKIVHDDGMVHYIIGGIISPMKPKPRCIFRKYIEGDYS